jgi:hypothetical protein
VLLLHCLSAPAGLRDGAFAGLFQASWRLGINIIAFCFKRHDAFI